MAVKKKRRNRHVPQRTCVGCRSTLSKKELMRVVRTTESIRYDESGKANGRGAYIHNQRKCWEQALKGNLEKALHATISEEDRTQLEQIMNVLPEEKNE